jgi:type IV fimbrial biogenesis protein FimT
MERESGFTIMELMVTVTLVAIIATFAFPSVDYLLRNSRLTSQLNNLAATLHYARSEAVKRGTPVTVCKTHAALQCDTRPGWERGWIVFVDDGGGVATGKGNGKHEKPELMLRVHEALEGGTTLRGNRNVAHRVTFSASGFSGGFNGTLRLCDARGARAAKALIVSRLGRIRRALDSNRDGIDEDGSGNNLSCP